MLETMRILALAAGMVLSVLFSNAPASASGSLLSGLPRYFEANRGQTDPAVDFLSRGDGYTLFLTGSGATLRLRAPEAEECQPCLQGAGLKAEAEAPRYAVLRMELAGGNPLAEVAGEEPMPGRSRYITPSRAEWKHGSNSLKAAAARSIEAAHFGRVRYRGVYPGVDVVYYGQGRRLEYDFEVAPGADPKKIRLRFEGASAMRLDADGNLVLETAAGPIVQKAPVAFQEIAGERRPVESRFVLDGGEVGIRLGAYDRDRPLIIDPVLSYATFVGGSGNDEAWAVAVDKDGNILVAGDTDSTDFPRQNPAFGTYAGGTDGFVSKISADGKTLVYSTYIGGVEPQGWDSIAGLAVDADGNAVLAGRLSLDVLLVELNPAGQSVFAIAFGGQAGDEARDIAIGADGTLFLTGVTRSIDWEGTPENEGFPVWPENAFQLVRKSNGDAFVSRIDASDPEDLFFVYSTYLGGTSTLLDDEGRAIAVDAAGHAYVTGTTQAIDFPITASGRQQQHGGHLSDAFLVKMSPDGTQVLYGTYLGGGFNEESNGVVADNNGNAWVAGWTNSHDFPTTPGSFSPGYNIGDCDPSPTGILPCADAFIVKVDTTKTGAASFAYSTFFGGMNSDYAYGLAVDAEGNAFIVGQTLPVNFPVQDPISETGAGRDVFVAKLNAAGSALLLSTRYGGFENDKGNAIALDRDRNIVIAGRTWSMLDLPVRNALQPLSGGGLSDAFVAKITMGGTTPVEGDVDGNGQFTMDDIKMALRIASGIAAGTSDQVARGESAPPAGAMTITDVTTLLRKL